jgi:hypothetical protein
MALVLDGIDDYKEDYQERFEKSNTLPLLTFTRQEFFAFPHYSPSGSIPISVYYTIFFLIASVFIFLKIHKDVTELLSDQVRLGPYTAALSELL